MKCGFKMENCSHFPDASKMANNTSIVCRPYFYFFNYPGIAEMFFLMFSMYFLWSQAAWMFFWFVWVRHITPSIIQCSLMESVPLLSFSKLSVSQNLKLDERRDFKYVSSVSESFSVCGSNNNVLFLLTVAPKAVMTLWMRCLTWLKAWAVYRCRRKRWLCLVLLCCSHRVRLHLNI